MPSPVGSAQPWFHETAGPQFFNEWSITHLVWGILAAGVVGYTGGLVAHTVYESIEGRVFPDAHRDTSMRNHIGDTLAFAAGMILAKRLGVR